ncbi:DUF4268 domain-containing protein [Emticicia sp. TH156]|uniref:DUF4268 domain-containing protein n=1 Tax=Emticicia sp. TH156 TaxID=2067454 RepID=UPI000C78FC22|nr:DUF4268 domain-containing protein [Emticicia sp. TH156]PLK44487.1 hypothetical protein C0V77_11940 [Emticicia sp. TH156]
MYLINKETNKIEELKKVTFNELGFNERQHLQEWLENTPTALGEDLLIIQKEFSEFAHTNERLDLLALDKSGNLVLIENKLDDSGRDVTWQALKYASYCSTLTSDEIEQIYQKYLNSKGNGENAQNKLTEFYGQSEYKASLNTLQSQRIILVARKFRKEVTSTVLWLLNFQVKIQCFKVTPYPLGEQVILDLEQIIPPKDVEDYTIKMAAKVYDTFTAQEKAKDRTSLNLEFWAKLLAKIKGKSGFFQTISPSKDHWINSGRTGISGVAYCFAITSDKITVELSINNRNKEVNKQIFDELKSSYENQINESFGEVLSWERLDNKLMSRIAYSKYGSGIHEKEQWDEMIDWLIEHLIKLEGALNVPLQKLKTTIN